MSQETTAHAQAASARSAAFLADWETHCTFGAVPGTHGVDRQAATEPDGQQRRWFEQLLREHGFTVIRDEIGNQFGLLELVPGAPYVLTGSHLDSQPTAGRFDGAYGVMASAHAAFRLAEHFAANPEQARCNIAVVNWFNEEGSRFKPSMMGSGVFTGKLDLAEALETRDKQGVSVREALDALAERGEAPVELDLAAYAEIHVEQGRSMEEDGVTIGLVAATWAAHKYELRIRGEQAHSGSALMRDRRDALLGAAKLIVAARELVDHYDEGALHTAVGEITVYPNSPVVVASEARILLDLRSPSMEVIDSAAEKLRATMAEVEKAVGVEIDIVHEHAWDQNPYQPEGTELSRAVAEALGLPHGEVLTVAGHDSTNMKDLVPTVMLFVPSVEGISHNLNEFTKDEDLLAGVDHLTEVLRRIVMDPSVVAGAQAG